MNFLTSNSANLSDAQLATFRQGAQVIASDGHYSAGLWYQGTPLYQGEKTGTIGACEIDENAADFLRECADFLHREHDCRHVLGPMNGNTWLDHRLVLDSDGRPPFLMEPQSPEHFSRTFEQAGFSLLSQYSSSVIDLKSQEDTCKDWDAFLQKRGLSIRPISLENYEADLSAIFDLSLESFSQNFLYTPLPREAFLGKYMAARDHIDPHCVLLAECEGELAGFVFCMPDRHIAPGHEKPAMIVKTLAVAPQRRFAGLGTLLVAMAQQHAREQGYTEAIHALQYEDNRSLRISERFDAKVFRRYGLMIKSFT